jgi:DNA-directed RNA polymerase beta subunit
MNKLIKKFGRIKDSIDIPHLLSLQLDSYNKFLQTDVPPSMRTDIGLEGVFRSVFPIHDFNKTATLEYVSYDIGKPKYDVDECIAKGLTFEAPCVSRCGSPYMTSMRRPAVGLFTTSRSKTYISERSRSLLRRERS